MTYSGRDRHEIVIALLRLCSTSSSINNFWSKETQTIKSHSVLISFTQISWDFLESINQSEAKEKNPSEVNSIFHSNGCVTLCLLELKSGYSSQTDLINQQKTFPLACFINKQPLLRCNRLSNGEIMGEKPICIYQDIGRLTAERENPCQWWQWDG